MAREHDRLQRELMIAMSCATRVHTAADRLKALMSVHLYPMCYACLLASALVVCDRDELRYLHQSQAARQARLRLCE